MTSVELLTLEERLALPAVILRRNKFKGLIKATMVNYRNTLSNCMVLQGRPGTGKTTLVTEYLDQLVQEGIVGRVRRAAGHITPRSMYQLLADTRDTLDGAPSVLVLDDIDGLKDEGVLELMKSAFDTKSKHYTNRQVYYMTDSGSGFKYNGMAIIITNDELDPKKINVHQKALMDRVRRVTVDLNEGDAIIYNISLIEDYLNKNEDRLSEKQMTSIVKLFNEEMRPWIEKDVFRRANINFSIRLVKKFVDNQKLFGDDWKDYDADYAALKAAYEMALVEDAMNETANNPVVSSSSANRIFTSEKGKSYEMRNGLFIDPNTQKPFSSTYQKNLKAKFNVA